MNTASRIFLVLICFISSGIVYAYETSLKLRPYVFIPRAHLYREIYGKVSGGVELEAETIFCHGIGVWANVDGLFKRGHSLGLCCPTKIGIFNFSFGPKWLYTFCDERFSLYLGVGPTFAGVFVRNKSVCCINKVNKFSPGVVAKTGFYWHVNDCVFLELFGDYLYQPVHFQHHVDVGGGKIGLGVGYTF